MNSTEKPVTTADVARHFGVTTATVRRWVRDGRIPCIRVSRRVVRFHLADVERQVSHRTGVSDGQ